MMSYWENSLHSMEFKRLTVRSLEEHDEEDDEHWPHMLIIAQWIALVYA